MIISFRADEPRKSKDVLKEKNFSCTMKLLYNKHRLYPAPRPVRRGRSRVQTTQNNSFLQPPTLKPRISSLDTKSFENNRFSGPADQIMTMKSSSEISQENSMEKLTKPLTAKDKLLLFASRIVQICSDLNHQPESTSVIENDSQSLVKVEGSENTGNGEEPHSSRGHYIEVEGPSARTQGSKATPESVHNAADDVITVNLEYDEQNISNASDDSDVVEFLGSKSLRRKTTHNSLDALEQECSTRKGKLPNLRPQKISDLRTYSIYSGSESERKELEPRMDATLTLGMDQSTASQQLDNAKDNVEPLSRVVNLQKRHGNKTSSHVKTEAPSQRVLRTRKYTQPASHNEPLAESGEETHTKDVAMDSFETGISTSSSPVNHRARSPNSRYTCTFCGKHQFWNSRLVLHLRTHTGERPFPCSICDKHFSRSSTLHVHLRTHTGEKPFPCTLCEKRFITSAHLTRHLRTHTGEKPFPCTLCEKRFSQSTQLTYHLKTHTGEKPFPCTLCEKRFSLSDHLTYHLRTHTGEKPFPCTLCEKRFITSAHLTYHLKTHTGEKPFPCTLCEKRFSRSDHLTYHLRTHTGEKPFPCTLCENRFSQSTQLTYHLRTHTGEKPFPCTLCEKRFSRSDHLTYHLRTHTGEKPFPCTLCEKRFSQSTQLTYHLRTHTGEKPFPCTLCEKRFITSAHLTYHLRTHTGEKPFPCTLCEKRFITSVHLTCHLRTHTGEKPFPCTLCEKRFSQSAHLTYHLKTHGVTYRRE